MKASGAVLQIKIGDYQTKEDGGKTDGNKMKMPFPVHDLLHPPG